MSAPLAQRPGQSGTLDRNEMQLHASGQELAGPGGSVTGSKPGLVMTNIITLRLFNIAMENGPFIDGLPGFTY
jgi:hypothetical protein